MNLSSFGRRWIALADAVKAGAAYGFALLSGTNTWTAVQTFSAIPVLSGGAISFPATQVASAGANDLDDYEEGTWTPTWTGSITNPAIGNGSIVATYVKLGKSCNISLLVQMGSTTTFGSGVWSFTLPFTAASTNGGGSVSALDAGTANRAGAVQVLTTTTIGFVSDGSGNNWGQLIPHTWANPDYLKAGLSYITAS